MIARNRIWEELKQAKSNILCLQKYIDKRRAYNRCYNGIVALIASAGALGYAINELIPFAASLIVGFISIVKSIMPSFLQTEPELSELDGLSDFYVRYMNSIEKIWYDFNHDFTEEKETMEFFFKLKESECDKESLLNRGVRNISKKFQKEIDDEAEEYINRVYFTKKDERNGEENIKEEQKR